MAKAPNILLLMADQLAAPALPAYGHPTVRTPALDRLAARGVTFANAYCNFPLCAPSRFSMLSGRLASRIDTFDNAAEFPASIPTFVHYLRGLGYRTILSGKMHFIGPDQLHGFEERLTTDIYPADFGWTADWREGERNKPTGISMRPVLEAGICYRNLQIDFDEEVEFEAVQKLYDLARDDRGEPFFLCVSFSNPHPPFMIMPEFWELYRHDAIDPPSVPPIPLEQSDALSRWLHVAHGADLVDIAESHVQNARHAYYGMVSYIDAKVTRVLAALERAGFADRTAVVFTSDHGEMLGERGMWYKQSFYEWSARVPLIVSFPGGFAPRRVDQVVSLVDLFPTLLDLATAGQRPDLVDPIDGQSLAGLLAGSATGTQDEAISEYLAEGALEPCRMIRRGKYKYVYLHKYGGQLFDLEKDPRELHDLSGCPQHAAIEANLRAALLHDWDPEEVKARVLASQRRRLFLRDVLGSGRVESWEYRRKPEDARRFVRSGGSPGQLKARSRWPRGTPGEPAK